jgi:hypothetical protein
MHTHTQSVTQRYDSRRSCERFRVQCPSAPHLQEIIIRHNTQLLIRLVSESGWEPALFHMCGNKLTWQESNHRIGYPEHAEPRFASEKPERGWNESARDDWCIVCSDQTVCYLEMLWFYCDFKSIFITAICHAFHFTLILYVNMPIIFLFHFEFVLFWLNIYILCIAHVFPLILELK